MMDPPLSLSLAVSGAGYTLNRVRKLCPLIHKSCLALCNRTPVDGRWKLATQWADGVQTMCLELLCSVSCLFYCLPSCPLIPSSISASSLILCYTSPIQDYFSHFASFPQERVVSSLCRMRVDDVTEASDDFSSLEHRHPFCDAGLTARCRKAHFVCTISHFKSVWLHVGYRVEVPG